MEFVLAHLHLLLPSVKNIKIPSSRSTISAIYQTGGVYTTQTINYGTCINYFTNYGDHFLPQNTFPGTGSITLSLNNTTVPHLINLEATEEDFDYIPFHSISNNGSNYKFGDLWYIKNNNQIVSHGYLDPNLSGGLDIKSFIYIQKSKTNMDEGNYGLCFVTKTGSGFGLSGSLNYDNKYLINYNLKTRPSFPTGEYELFGYTANNKFNNLGNTNLPRIHLINSDLIPTDIDYGNQTFAIVNSPILDTTNIYQKTETQDYIKTRLYSMFGKKLSFFYGLWTRK